MLWPYFCQNVAYKLSVIVIDKSIGLGGTVYTPGSTFVCNICTTYHQNNRFENSYGNQRR